MNNYVYKGSDVSIKLNFGNYSYTDFVYVYLTYFTSATAPENKIECSYVKDTSELINMQLSGGSLYALLPSEKTELFAPGKLRCVIRYGLIDTLFPDSIKDVIEEIPTNVEIKTII